MWQQSATVSQFLHRLLSWSNVVINFTFNPLITKLCLSDLKTQSVQHSKHSLLRVLKTDKLKLYREIIAVCSEIHTKHINTPCGHNVELYINI